MNQGKSTFMNTLTQQNTSIVDSFAGTTADTKVALMEIHGLGPCKFFDTAGLDEAGSLGSKKHRKTINVMHQSNVVVLLIDPENCHYAPAVQNFPLTDKVLHDYARGLVGREPSKDDLQRLLPNNKYVQYLERLGEKNVKDTEKMVITRALEDARPLLVYINCKAGALPTTQFKTEIAEWTAYVNDLVAQHTRRAAAQASKKKRAAPFVRVRAINLHHTTAQQLAGEIAEAKKASSYQSMNETAYLPSGLVPGKPVLLIIPLDEESPKSRLLKPQTMTIEALIAKYIPVKCLRVNLGAMRGKYSEEERAQELSIFREQARDCQLIITDSQAIDQVSDHWPGPVTTFSVMQSRFLSGPHFTHLVDGLQKLDDYRKAMIGAPDAARSKFRILVCEACNHDRITDHCDDIGTVQIPRMLEKLLGQEVEVSHSYGRDDEFISSDTRNRYDLVIHCGGCMISRQQMVSRIKQLVDLGVSVTNYGLFFSYAKDAEVLKRVLKPYESD